MKDDLFDSLCLSIKQAGEIRRRMADLEDPSCWTELSEVVAEMSKDPEFARALAEARIYVRREMGTTGH